MKNMFRRLHRTTLVGFPLLSILLILYQLLFGQWPVILVALWVIALSLFVMVLLACIIQNVARLWQAGARREIALRYVAGAALAAVILIALDWTTGHILWAADLGAGLVLGLLALYAKP